MIMRNTVKLAALGAIAIGAFLVARNYGIRRVGSDSGVSSPYQTPLPIEASRSAGQAASAVVGEAMASVDGHGTATAPQHEPASGVGRSGGSSSSDPNWASLPRTDFSPASHVFEKQASLQEDQLFRNVVLNPTDETIGDVYRATLPAVTRPIKASLEQIGKMEAETALAEFDYLVKIGTADSVPIGDPSMGGRLNAADTAKLRAARDHARAALARRKGVPVEQLPADAANGVLVPEIMFKGQQRPYIMRVANGVLHSATLAKLPGTRQLIDAKKFLLSELLSIVCDWFAVIGTIDSRVKQEQMRELWFVMK